MGACFDRLRCEVFQNLFLSPMNTGFVRPAVATVLTVYGIETPQYGESSCLFKAETLQQYLPFTVLKLQFQSSGSSKSSMVATVLTVYGIETGDNGFSFFSYFYGCNSTYRLRYATKCARHGKTIGYCVGKENSNTWCYSLYRKRQNIFGIKHRQRQTG